MEPLSILGRSVQIPSDAHHISLASQKQQMSPASKGLPTENPHDLEPIEPLQTEDNR